MADITVQMDKTIENLKHNFAKVRTGRANANILSDITVDYYGVASPITQVAAVKTPEAHMLVVEPWDKALVNAIVKAISASDLGITPSSDGSLVRLPFPAPTEERRRELVKECASWPSTPRSLSATSAATLTASSSATRTSPRTMFVASRPRCRSTPTTTSRRSTSF